MANANKILTFGGMYWGAASIYALYKTKEFNYQNKISLQHMREILTKDSSFELSESCGRSSFELAEYDYKNRYTVIIQKNGKNVGIDDTRDLYNIYIRYYALMKNGYFLFHLTIFPLMLFIDLTQLLKD